VSTVEDARGGDDVEIDGDDAIHVGCDRDAWLQRSRFRLRSCFARLQSCRARLQSCRARLHSCLARLRNRDRELQSYHNQRIASGE